MLLFGNDMYLIHSKYRKKELYSFMFDVFPSIHKKRSHFILDAGNYHLSVYTK